MPDVHATLSASASKRWLTCTPSALFEKKFPSSSSVYAAEGTLAHSFGERKLRHLFMGEPLVLDDLRADELYSPEIDECSDLYVEHVRTIYNLYSSPPLVGIEERLDMSDAVPGGFGTGDCVIVGDGRLDIIDYKHGSGVLVDAHNNTQLRLYAYGAYQKCKVLYDVKTIGMHIVQPRLDNFSDETISTTELLGWIEWVKGRAELAAKGEGEYVPGDHCRFCRAKAVCRARAERYSALADFGFATPPAITDDEVGEILSRGEEISSWLSEIKEYARDRILAGGEIKGWKVVEGRSVRALKDVDTAIDTLAANGVSKDLMYERKPLPLTGLEKLVGKRRFGELLADQIYKKPGAPTLAHESDKRAPFSGVKQEFTDS